MISSVLRAVLIFISSFLFHILYAEEPQAPRPTGYVNDFAHVLPQKTHHRLERQLEAFDQLTKVQVAIAIFPEFILPGTIEDNAELVYRQWGIGYKGKDEGVLLILCLKERKLRIEVGYGLEATLTDGKAGEIIRKEIVPYLQQDKISKGISNGTSKILQTINAEAFNKLRASSPKQPKQEEENPSLQIVELIAIIFFLALFTCSLFGKRWGLSFLFAFFVLLLIFESLLKGIILGSISSFISYLLSEFFNQNNNRPGGGGFYPPLSPSQKNAFKKFKGFGGGKGGFGGGSSGGGGASGGW